MRRATATRAFSTLLPLILAAAPLAAQPQDPQFAANVRGAPIEVIGAERSDESGLLAVLQHYRAIAALGGWGRIAAEAPHKPGAGDPRLEQAKRRLRASGDLDAGAPSLGFGDRLGAGLRAFQRRHGLSETGVLDAATIAELNVPVETRIAQIAANLDRRVPGPHLGDRFIFVNAAEKALYLYEQGRVVLRAHVIVGKPHQQTPELKATMTYIEINPWWNVPASIALSEMLPIIRNDPRTLHADNYVLVQGGRSVDPGSVDWDDIPAQNFPFAIRQRPGPENALGHMLFMFPNRNNVFIHDTPHRHLLRTTTKGGGLAAAALVPECRNLLG